MDDLEPEYKDVLDIIISNTKNGARDKSFTKEEILFKRDIKKEFSDYAGSAATREGYADFIWRLFIDSVAKCREQEAIIDQQWEVKRKDVASAVINSTQKYADLLKEKDKEIDFLQGRLANLAGKYGARPPEMTSNTENSNACKNCGAISGCYCN